MHESVRTHAARTASHRLHVTPPHRLDRLVWVNEFVRLDSTPAKCTASQRSKVDASMRGSRQLLPEAAAGELGGDSGVAEGEAEVG